MTMCLRANGCAGDGHLSGRAKARVLAASITFLLKSPMDMKRTTSRTQDIDRHVGARIRERRIMLGLTQQQLADLIGVTYQQAHKYERGINRVSAGRLFEVARVLSVPVAYFFEGLDQQAVRTVSARERMCLELARNFAQIPNEKHQEALSQLARALATHH